MSIHEGHRQRVKDRFAREGLDNFEPHQLLELLLFYCIPRRDTNEIAHRLLEKFGSFHNVMDAHVKDLEQVEGLGTNAALFLTLIRDVERFYHISRRKGQTALTKRDEYCDYLTAFFENKDNETVYLLGLDAKCSVLGCRKVAEGSLHSVSVPIRKIVDTAISMNATSVVLAHNHPSGLAQPSVDDINTTIRVSKALAMIDVVLIDHVIVSDDNYISFTYSGLYNINMGRE